MKLSFVLSAVFVCVFGSNSLAADLGFRYKEGKCVDSKGAQGLNPSFFGPCSDLRGTTLHGLDFSGIDFRGSTFFGADLQRSSFAKTNLEGTSFENTILTGVKFDEALVIKSNFNKANLKEVKFSETQISESSFENAVFESGDLSYISFSKCNLKGANFIKARLDEAQFLMSDLAGAKFIEANLTKASFTSSTLTQTDFGLAKMTAVNLSNVNAIQARFANADLSNAKLMGAQLAETNLSRAKLTGANLANVNLQKANLKTADLTGTNFEGAKFQGAVISPRTLLPFSMDDAKKLGMIVINVRTVLLLWDQLNDYVKSFATALNTLSDGEVEVNLAPVVDSMFNGTQVNVSNFDAVIHLNGAEPHGDEIALDGQKALVTYVQNGGTFIYGEWEAYAVSNGQFTQMRDLILFQRSTGTSQGAMHTVVDAMKSHPLMKGISSPFQVESSAGNIGPVITFASNPVLVLANDNRNSPSVGLRMFGKGRVVGFNFTCTYERMTCLNEGPVRQLYINAITNLE